jgi:hypothetical protein
MLLQSSVTYLRASRRMSGDVPARAICSGERTQLTPAFSSNEFTRGNPSTQFELVLTGGPWAFDKGTRSSGSGSARTPNTMPC